MKYVSNLVTDAVPLRTIVFIINFKYISHIFLVFLSLILSKQRFAGKCIPGTLYQWFCYYAHINDVIIFLTMGEIRDD